MSLTCIRRTRAYSCVTCRCNLATTDDRDIGIRIGAKDASHDRCFTSTSTSPVASEYDCVHYLRSGKTSLEVLSCCLVFCVTTHTERVRISLINHKQTVTTPAAPSLTLTFIGAAAPVRSSSFHSKRCACRESMDDSSAGDVGVATALGRICALEAKLRQAIQHTHLLSSSFESDPAAADREREALLAIR